MFMKFIAGGGWLLLIIVLHFLLQLILIPLWEQWTDGHLWNGEWPFFRKKEK